MSLRLIERRIERLEESRTGGLVLIWANSAEDALAKEAAALELDPRARVIVVRWAS